MSQAMPQCRHSAETVQSFQTIMPKSDFVYALQVVVRVARGLSMSVHLGSHLSMQVYVGRWICRQSLNFYHTRWASRCGPWVQRYLPLPASCGTRSCV